MAQRHKIVNLFNRSAHAITAAAGSPITFAVATALVILWFIGGFVVGFTDQYQLLINTTTTITTTLMVFLIQSSSNREGRALQAKLDELIRVQQAAKDDLIGLEGEDDDKIEEVNRQLQSHRERAGNDTAPQSN